MGIFDKIFRKKEESIKSYKDFWDWFVQNEKKFYQVIKKQKNVEKGFMEVLSSKLLELRNGYHFLAGIGNDGIIDLIITADGYIPHIVFVEEIIQTAPTLPNWKFQAHKPATLLDNIGLKMNGYTYDSENISFYAIEHKNYPDEVDIVLVYDDFNEDDKVSIQNGIFIFIDNYLGEINAVTTIDNMNTICREQAAQELIPIPKLKDYLIWREKEFVEKQLGISYSTKNDKFGSFEAEVIDGQPIIAIMNTSILKWKNKTSHPWILTIEVHYDGSENNGLPNKGTLERIYGLEDEIMIQLKDADGYLHLGKQSSENLKEIYFACKDFRVPSKRMDEIIKRKFPDLKIEFQIYKDKYWQSFEQFRL